MLRELADKADILVENFKPGVMAEMNMSYEQLRERNPRLIFTSVTGFGRGGPYSDWPGVDQIAQGMSGLMSVTGQEATGPTRVGIPIGDVVAGMWGALGTQAAVIQRMSTGRGQLVETSLLGGLIGLLNVQAQRALTLNDVSGVVGNDHPVVCPCGVFMASDGAFNMAVVSQDMWVKLCELLDVPDMVHDAKYKDNTARLANRDELRERLNEKFAARDKMAWTHELIKLGLPAGPLFTMDQVFADPHVIQTGMVEEIEHPTLGMLKQLSNPIRMEGLGPRTVRTPPPLLGQHTEEVLRDMGVSPSRISDLARDGVIAFCAEQAKV